jgi:hypothetical protein
MTNVPRRHAINRGEGTDVVSEVHADRCSARRLPSLGGDGAEDEDSCRRGQVPSVATATFRANSDSADGWSMTHACGTPH